MNRRNYQREMDGLLDTLTQQRRVPNLLLHSCCAPCSSYVIEYLSSYFHITVFYYNPNLYPEAEYEKRKKEQQRFLLEFPAKHPVRFLSGDFEKDRFYAAVKGLEGEKEGGRRCARCYRLRLRKTAETAAALSMDYFATTLTISPLKQAKTINEIGGEAAKACGVAYLCSDFKKKNGFLRSVALSDEYGMYRQDYCGCIFSRQEREHARHPFKDTHSQQNEQ